MAIAYIKVDLEFDLHNDDDPDLEPINERYTPGWNDRVPLSLIRASYPVPNLVALDKEDLVSGIFDVKADLNSIHVKCSGIFKVKVSSDVLRYATTENVTWHFGGLSFLYGKLGNVFSNGKLIFDPSTRKKNPSTSEYQRSWEISVRRKEGPEVDVMFGKTKNSITG